MPTIQKPNLKPNLKPIMIPNDPSNINPTVEQVGDWLRQVALAKGLSSNSRSIVAGDVFVAYPGDIGDGRKYIADALAGGAVGVLYDPQQFTWDDSWGVPHLPLADLKQRAGAIAAGFYAHPDAAMLTVAVTGTNGKTSSALWLGRALSRQGQAACVIGTLGVGLFKRGDGVFEETGYTTPDAVLLQRKLAQMRDAGAQAMAIEASSIGLEQGRLNSVHFDIALFTNLTRDHLDFHGDMAAYEASKNRLFDWPGLKHAVLNMDDPMGERLAQRLHGKLQVIGYTLGKQAFDGIALLRASELRSRHAGTEFHLESPFGAAQVKTRMVGRFNVSNVLGVLGVLLAQGWELPLAVKAVEALTPAPGRMQQLGGQDAPLVVVDYAHTPDALEKTLAALLPVAQERGGQLWCVFGCGGDRDPGKRPQMGAIAQAAEHVIVTSDNPRNEDPRHIIEQIMQGITPLATVTATVIAIEDRAAAILSAVKHAAKNDVVLIAGKGHEPYQEIKGKKLPFSDVDQAALALATRPTMKRSA